MSQYTNELIGVASTHQKNDKNQHKYYKSSMDLLGLLLWFQRKSQGCFASTSWLAQKMEVSERAILKTLRLLEMSGYILRTKLGRRRVITCLIEKLPQYKSIQKSTCVKAKKVHLSNSIYIEQKLHNTNVDVVLDALVIEGVAPKIARSLVQKYSRGKIREAINACKRQSDITNKPGWIVRCISSNWQTSLQVCEQPPQYQIYKRPTEQVDRSGYRAGIELIKKRLATLRKECTP